MSRLKDMYKAEVAPALMNKFAYKSVMQVPKFDKIVINVGVGDAKDNSKAIDSVITDISAIAGQKAVPTYARKSVANFKLRMILIHMKTGQSAAQEAGSVPMMYALQSRIKRFTKESRCACGYRWMRPCEMVRKTSS